MLPARLTPSAALTTRLRWSKPSAQRMVKPGIHSRVYNSVGCPCSSFFEEMASKAQASYAISGLVSLMESECPLNTHLPSRGS